MLDLVIEALRSDRAALLLEEDGELVQRAVRGQDGDELSVSRTIANTVLDKQVSVLTADAGTDERFEGGQSIAIQGIRAAMAVPLWNNERVIGLIYADSRMSRRTFDEDDLKLLTMLGNVAAIQIENSRLFADQLEKRRLANEARTAASIQERLLPGAPPDIDGYRLLGATVPCYEVGGDYYDWLELGGQRRGFILGDVAGKGMGAALIMAAVQATIHARVDSGPTAGELVARLNDAVDRSAPDERFVTVLYADLDLAANRLDCVNAGHAPTPLVVRASGELAEIPASGPPLGIIAGYEHSVQPIELGPGDFLFICSDGVTEATNPEGDMFGDDRLHQLLISKAGKSPLEIRTALERELAAHVRGADADDDVTVLIVQRNP